MTCCKGKGSKVSLDLSWGSPWPSHHPTASKKDSSPSVHLPKLSESYTDHSIMWEISFWRWTNWHPQRRGFLSRGKLGFTCGAHLKVCFAIRFLAEWYYMFIKILITLLGEQGIMYPFIHCAKTAETLWLLLFCMFCKKTRSVFKQLFVVHLLWTGGCNYCSKALGSVKHAYYRCRRLKRFFKKRLK